MRENFIGVMSGTSQDGIDAVLAFFDSGKFAGVRAHYVGRYEPELRSDLLELSREATPVSLAHYALLDRRVADAFSLTIERLLEQAMLSAGDVVAIGSHGQTVFHDAAQIGNSLQLGDPSRIAARCGIPVVADFRRADMALGGQGAPLLPIFHHAIAASALEPRAVLNLGGIANLTLLPDLDVSRVTGFDCGPASCLMDEWTERHLGQAFDAEGQWAAGGSVENDLLNKLMLENYLVLPPPKSTGRGLFNLAWLEARDADLHRRNSQNVQATLAEFTARCVEQGLKHYAPATKRLFVCGGGVGNRHLFSRITELLAPVTVETVDALELDPQQVEASAFAWLACRRLKQLPGNIPSVTGASRGAILGGIFQV